MEAFEPELLIVSAGFDAHVDDPLAGMRVTADGFREMAARCTQLAPRVAAVLEGGYNLETLPGLVEAALDGFTLVSNGNGRGAARPSQCGSTPRAPSRNLRRHSMRLHDASGIAPV